tara:strand:+ start:1276 stop:2841 length:1566 start_codon:yes stop_codon:yes gene_type:complete
MLKKKYISFYIIISFSIYCALIIGQSWDEVSYITLGKERLSYLFSLGINKVSQPFWNSHHYPGISYTINAFLLSLFSTKYELESIHLINLLISISAVFGISKVAKELFNKKVSLIIFTIFILYPTFFGHMAINANDTVVATCNVWITYLILKYLKKQKDKNKNKYLFFISFLVAVGTGVRLVFVASLIPQIIFILFDILVFKKFLNNNFSKRILYQDLLKIIFTSYIIVILFWAPTHTNILILPINFFIEMISNTNVGWPIGLINGEYFFSHDPPISYLLLNLFFKTPEYILFLYLLSILFIFYYNKFFEKNFKDFNYKILFILTILVFPNFLMVLKIFPIYDGLRLFLYVLPFFLLIPSLSLFVLIVKYKEFMIKVFTYISLFLFIFFIIKFIIITPYHYLYLNSLSGNFENKEKNFENDYWGISMKELIKKSKFLNEDYNKLAICGANPKVVKFYLKKYNFSKVKIVREDEKYDFIIMTNRTIYNPSEEVSKTQTCFQKYKGKNVSSVKRGYLTISQIK